MPQYKVIRIYRVHDAEDADDAALQLKHWLTTLHAREMLDVEQVWEKVSLAEEKEGAVKQFAKTARDQVLGSKEPDHRAA
jgi:hypothetical protein